MRERARLHVAPQDSSWAARIRGRILGFDQPVAVLAPPVMGFEFVIAGMSSRQRPLVWAAFDERDEGDSISQGAKLAEAVERALGAAVFGFGMPLPQVLARLTRRHSLLGPFVVCISGLKDSREIEVELSTLASVGSSVILHWRSSEHWHNAVRSPVVAELEPRELYLKREEADEILGGSSLVGRLMGLGGNRPGSMALLQVLKNGLEHRELGVLLVPRPGGAEFLEADDEDTLDVPSLVQALMSRGRAIDAFELLARSGATIPDEVASTACRDYFERGLHDRCWRVMADISTMVRWSSEAMMRWWFSAATAVNAHGGIRDEVRRYLERHEAPELRALYAAAFPGPESLEESIRAHEALQTPTTLRIRAFADSVYGSGADTVRLLEKALRLAERLGDHATAIATATELADYWSRNGAYGEAIAWAQWAVDWYWRSGCRDELRRLVAASMLTYCSLLAGDRQVDVAVDDEESLLSVAGIPTSEVLLSTAAETAIVSGDLARAERVLRVLLDRVQLGQFSSEAVDLVHVLTQAGKHEEALALGRRARAVSREMGRRQATLGRLAYGLSMVGIRPNEAGRQLDAVVNELLGVTDAPRLAQAAIALGVVQLRIGDVAGAASSLERGDRGLRELGPTGWTLLGGYAPEIRVLREMYGQDVRELELSFLGGSSIRLKAQEMELGRRQCEVLTVLAMNPRGLSAESLGLRVYGDAALLSTIKAIVSRLRQSIPIASKPYRIDVEFWADFLEVEALAASGRYREAVSLYRGPLLPDSDAPAIVEAREHLDELVRSAVLRSGDVEAILSLSDLLGDDLELLEVALERLSAVDIRVPLVRAKRNRIARDWGRA